MSFVIGRGGSLGSVDNCQSVAIACAPSNDNLGIVAVAVTGNLLAFAGGIGGRSFLKWGSIGGAVFGFLLPLFLRTKDPKDVSVDVLLGSTSLGAVGGLLLAGGLGLVLRRRALPQNIHIPGMEQIRTLFRRCDTNLSQLEVRLGKEVQRWGEEPLAEIRSGTASLRMTLNPIRRRLDAIGSVAEKNQITEALTSVEKKRAGLNKSLTKIVRGLVRTHAIPQRRF